MWSLVEKSCINNMILFLNKLAARIIQARYKALAWNSKNAYIGNNGVWHWVKGDLPVGAKRILPPQPQCSEHGSSVCRAKGSFRPLSWCHSEPEDLHGRVAGNTRTRALAAPAMPWWARVKLVLLKGDTYCLWLCGGLWAYTADLSDCAASSL